MVKEVVLGIDLGTSAIKIIAVDQLGNVIESVSETLNYTKSILVIANKTLMNGLRLLRKG